MVALVYTQSTDPSGTVHYDWGESRKDLVSVLEGEVSWISCPLFSHPSVYNYTSALSAGHTLVWYRVPEGQDLEQPIQDSLRLSKDRDRLWLQPAAVTDAGLYICMLCNKSSCSKMAVRLEVLLPDRVPRRADCEPPVAVAPTQAFLPLQQGRVLDCPDVDAVDRMADGEVTVTWMHVFRETQRCRTHPFWNSDREQRGRSLQFHVMLDTYSGVYFCTVRYLRRGRSLHFTRSVNVTAVSSTVPPKHPTVLLPAKDLVSSVTLGEEVRLVCRGHFPYLDSDWDIWWTVDGKTLDKVQDHQRFSSVRSQVKWDYGDRTEDNVLVIQDFGAQDLKREFNCSVRNERGFETRRVQLEKTETLPSLELGCGLGVVLVLMLVLFVVYHVFWLELLLLYRSWFGTDERHTDDKEFDVYISYSRNSEDEQFVLTTLRSVLENQLGYSVCLFDRDSLPGGVITDETLSFVARSRRLLVVVSPGYAALGSQTMLELKAGLDGMALGGHLRVVLIQYKPVQRQGWVRELRRARVALALVQWKGDKSKELSSRFWKRLRVELPVRRQEDSRRDAVLMRLSSQNSTSSQTGLLSRS
ncbi:uncharacterized protein V6R79_001901 [Siganus canaliculatus]